MKIEKHPRYKWLVLALATSVNMLAVGVPWTAMPVLFKDISGEIGLSLGQIGIVWSMLPIGAAIFSLPGGLLGDRFGPCLAIGVSCILIGISGGLRGASADFTTLAFLMFLLGLFTALGFPNLMKIITVYFPSRQLALANGIVVSGFGVGGTLATALSAGWVMSIWGSWQKVLFFYGGISILLGVLWLILIKEARGDYDPGDNSVPRPSFRQSLGVVIRNRNVWLLAVACLMQWGGMMGVQGYLPIYLENNGIGKSTADTMVSTIFLFGVLGALVLPTMSDRLGARKWPTLIGSALFCASTYLMAISTGNLLWVILPVFGFLANGIFPLFMAISVETKGIGPVYAGTAAGLIIGVSDIGGFASPIIGGQLAEVNPLWPFVFWAALVLASVVCIFFVIESRKTQSLEIANA